MNVLTADFWEKEVAKLPGCRFCPMEGIWDLFRELEANPPKEKFTLISAYSDFGLFYQKDFHPNKDIGKRTGHIQYKEISEITDRYVDVRICGIHDDKKCNPKHKFSVKIDSLTIATFDKVPDCINKWYCTNCNVIEDRVEWILFGANEQGRGCQIVSDYYTQQKKKLLYLNVQNYTEERVNLKKHYLRFENCQDWLTVYPNCNRVIEDFYQDLADHAFILTPFGNGLDSYRIVESIACGSIPIIEECEWSKNFLRYNFPVLLVKDLFKIDKEYCLQSISKINNSKFDSSRKLISKEFWYDKIRREI